MVTKQFQPHTELKASDLNGLVQEINDGFSAEATSRDNAIQALGQEVENGIKTKATIVDLDNFRTTGAVLPLNAAYVFRSTPIHGVSGHFDFTGQDFIAFCIAHEDYDHTDHTVMLYLKSGNDYKYSGSFDTDDAETPLEKFIAKCFSANVATQESDGLMSAKDKKTLDGMKSEIDTLGQNVEELETNLFGNGNVNISSLDGYIRKNAWLNSTNEWNNINNENYEFVVIPINGSLGLKLSITKGNTSAKKSRYAVLTTYPNTSEAPSFTEDANFRGSLVVSGTIASRGLPTDARYILIWTKDNGENVTPSSFLIESDSRSGMLSEIQADVNVIKGKYNTLVTNSEKMNAEMLSLKEQYNSLNESASDITTLDNFDDGYGWINASGVWNNVGVQTFHYKVIPLERKAKLSISAGTRGARYVALNSIENIANANTPNYADGYNAMASVDINTSIEDVEIDAKYLLIWVSNSGGSLSPTSVKITFEKGVLKKIEETVSFLEQTAPKDYTPARWLAFGDSITESWYSWYDDSNEPQNYGGNTGKSKVYCAKVAKMTGKQLVNRGRGGEGWDCKAPSAEDPVHGARTRIDMMIADGFNFKDFDLVTFAYGINDYKGSTPLGNMDEDYATTYSVVSNMRYCIEKVIAQNPLAKIIVITPLNARGYKNARLGTESTNYALGFSHHGYTLAQMFDTMINVCKYYGIQYIDLTYSSPINRLNMVDTLPDGVHPSEDAHTQIARQMAREMTFY